MRWLMNYLLYGEESYLIEKEIEKIVAKQGLEEINLIRYDYTIDSLSKILEDCETVSFFSDKKGVILSLIHI